VDVCPVDTENHWGISVVDWHKLVLILEKLSFNSRLVKDREYSSC
jgi:hypothetical protein